MNLLRNILVECFSIKYPVMSFMLIIQCPKTDKLKICKYVNKPYNFRYVNKPYDFRYVNKPYDFRYVNKRYNYYSVEFENVKMFNTKNYNFMSVNRAYDCYQI